MYRLDRFKESGRITKAFLPARDLYKFDPVLQLPEVPKDHAINGASPTAPKTSDEVTPVPKSPVLSPTDSEQLKTPITSSPSFRPISRQRPIPPAPGRAKDYLLPQPERQVFIPFVFHQPELDEPFQPLVIDSGAQEHVSTPDSPSNSNSSEDLFVSPPGSPTEGQRSEKESAPPLHPSQPNIGEHVQEPKPITTTTKPIQRQRSGSYPPPSAKPGNTNDWSRRDNSELRHLGTSSRTTEQTARPRRERKPPVQLTYNEKGEQEIVRTKRTDL